MPEVTWIGGICVCDNCGAYAESEKEIKHHKTCKPGEAKKWEKIYEENEEE